MNFSTLPASSEVQQALKSFSCGWFMLHLNQKCSYKTLCATPAATCPHSPRGTLQLGISGATKMGHLNLERLSTVPRGWDMLCGGLSREKPTAFPGRGGRTDAAEPQQDKPWQHLQPRAPPPGGTQTYALGWVTFPNVQGRDSHCFEQLCKYSHLSILKCSQGEQSRICALDEQQWKTSGSVCAQPEQGAALE